MELLRIKNLSKTYKVGKENKKVLKNINLSFHESGLIVILGKSGSGKSTLLNIIGGLDKQSSGQIELNFKGKRSTSKKLRLNNIGFIFQHYHLLENETVMFNLMLPGLIHGIAETTVKEKAIKFIKYIGLEEDVLRKRVKLLSGGEKERIAILRGVMANPRILLADEPTGALDSENAIKAMELLKRASKKMLVILVTHNMELANQYADRIITLEEGKIKDDKEIRDTSIEIFRQIDLKPEKNKWWVPIINNNFKRRIKRFTVSFIGMSVSLVFCYLLFGFSNQSEEAINSISRQHLDYGSAVLRKELASESDSPISIIKTMRPNDEEIDDIFTKFSNVEILPNFDAIFATGNFYKNSRFEKNMHISYVLDFSDSIDSNLLDRKIDDNGTWKDVIINEKAREMLEDSELHYVVSYQNEFQNNIVETLDIDEKLSVVGVAKELDFLSVPKIYFNYKKLKEFLDDFLLENLSEKLGKNLSWFDVINEAKDTDEISSYSMRLFVKDHRDFGTIESINDYLENEVKLDSDCLSVKEAMISLTTAANVGLDIFLVIALLGSFLILGVFSYSAYIDDKKESSILSCLGASKLQIIKIFATESLVVAFSAFLLSTVISNFLQRPINTLLYWIIGIPGMIGIPFSEYYSIKGLLPIGVFSFVILTAYMFTCIPILFNKSVSIKKELSDL